MLRRTLLLTLLLSVSTFSLNVLADPFAGHGWFWYQMPPPPPKLAPIPKPVTPPPAPQKMAAPKKKTLKPFSVQWIRKYRKVYMLKAIDNPTPKNMQAFMLINKAMFNKAQDFASAFYYESHFNMALNPAVDYPHTQAGLAAYYAKEGAAKGLAFHYLSHHAGIFFFFSSTCPYCELQYQQLGFFLQHHPNFAHHVFYVSMDGKRLPNMPASLHIYPNTGQAKFFHLVETPALVLALPPKTFVVFAQGETVDAEINEQLLRAAVYYHLVPTNIYDGLTPGDRGVISAQQFNQLAKQHIKNRNPDSVIQTLDKATAKSFYNWGHS